jgi:hypothetical protein
MYVTSVYPDVSFGLGSASCKEHRVVTAGCNVVIALSVFLFSDV